MRKILQFCFLSAVSSAFLSAPSHAQTLRDSIEQAIQNHPSIASAQAGYAGAQYAEDLEKSDYYPEISFGITAGRVYQDNSTSRGLTVDRGAAYSGYGEGNIAVRQMIFDGFETGSRVNAANARLQSRGYVLLDREHILTLKVSRNYVDILRVSNGLNILSEQAESIKDYEQRIIAMVNEGVADEAELQQARDVSMVIDAAIADYEGQLMSAKATYVELTGHDVSKDLYVPKSLTGYISADVNDVVSKVLVDHPMLKSADHDAVAISHDVKAEKAQFYPDVSGELSYLKNDKKDVIGGESEDARAVIRMNWSFSTGGAVASATHQKQQQHLEAIAKKDEIERQIKRDIHQSYAKYQANQTKLALSIDRVDLNEKLLSAYKSQFEGARINLLSLMRAESQLYKARLEKSGNKFNLLAAEYDVLSASGMLKDIVFAQNTGADDAP